jgi:predicted nucleic acid-binding protein
MSKRPTPIFDTNIFGEIQRGKINQTDWQYLLRRRPRYGWKLSSVTALELLAGVDAAPPRDFPDAKARIASAYNLSLGCILEDPRHLLCREVLKIPFPAEELPPSSSAISNYMDVIRRANYLDQLLKTGLPYKGGRARLDTTSILTGIMAWPKLNWAATMERTADEMHPNWREQFKQTQRRRPPEKRKELGPNWQARQRPVFIKALLEWLGAGAAPDVMADFCTRLDAVLEFTIFITREFLLQPNYSLDNHQSDIFDMFQTSIFGLRSVRNCKQRSGPVDEDSPFFPGGANHVLH